jgi:hypothetical protein
VFIASQQQHPKSGVEITRYHTEACKTPEALRSSNDAYQ